MACSKHEFACIPISAIHNNMVLYEYELPWNTSSFVYSSFSPWKQQKRMPESFDIYSYVIIMVHVM